MLFVGIDQHMLSRKEDYQHVDCRGDGAGKKACRPAA